MEGIGDLFGCDISTDAVEASGDFTAWVFLRVSLYQISACPGKRRSPIRGMDDRIGDTFDDGDSSQIAADSSKIAADSS